MTANNNGNGNGGGLVTYGRTLARKMSSGQAAELLSNMDQGLERGKVHVIVTATSIPDLRNVECLMDDLDADQAIVALAVAARRLAQLHGRAPEPAAVVALDDAQSIRTKAEDIVDTCRSSRLEHQNEQLLTRSFDRSREACVRTVMVALATAAITADRLLTMSLPRETAAVMPASEPTAAEA